MKPSASCTESLLQGRLLFLRINLRVKTCVKPRKRAYGDLACRGGSQNLSL